MQSKYCQPRGDIYLFFVATVGITYTVINQEMQLRLEQPARSKVDIKCGGSKTCVCHVICPSEGEHIGKH